MTIIDENDDNANHKHSYDHNINTYASTIIYHFPILQSMWRTIAARGAMLATVPCMLAGCKFVCGKPTGNTRFEPLFFQILPQAAS